MWYQNHYSFYTSQTLENCLATTVLETFKSWVSTGQEVIRWTKSNSQGLEMLIINIGFWAPFQNYSWIFEVFHAVGLQTSLRNAALRKSFFSVSILEFPIKCRSHAILDFFTEDSMGNRFNLMGWTNPSEVIYFVVYHFPKWRHQINQNL